MSATHLAHAWAPYTRGCGIWFRTCARCYCLEVVCDTGSWRWQRWDLRPLQRRSPPPCREIYQVGEAA